MEQDLPDATPLMDADDIERALLGRPASMRRSEISQDVEVTPAARDASGTPWASRSSRTRRCSPRPTARPRQAVARLTHDLDVEEELALAMTRALARTADRLAVWQTQLMAEYVTGARPGPRPRRARRAGSRERRCRPTGRHPTRRTRRRDRAPHGLRVASPSGQCHHPDARRRRQRRNPSAPGRVIGFADLVSFTTWCGGCPSGNWRCWSNGSRGSPPMLSRLTEARHQDRGDEVLFIHTDPAAVRRDRPGPRRGHVGGRCPAWVRVGMAGQCGLPSRRRLRCHRQPSQSPHGRHALRPGLRRRRARSPIGHGGGFIVRPQRRRSLRGIGLSPRELPTGRGTPRCLGRQQAGPAGPDTIPSHDQGPARRGRFGHPEPLARALRREGWRGRGRRGRRARARVGSPGAGSRCPDLGLPTLDGLDVCRRIRPRG